MASQEYPHFERLRERVASVIAPIRSVDNQSMTLTNMIFTAKRTKAGRYLPESYLVYFLLVDLLGYKNLGRREKVNYSIPIEFNNVIYLVEHRKLGLGLLTDNPEMLEDDATTIANLICKAVKIAQPYFKHRANEVAGGSRLNLNNHSRALYDRYTFFRKNFTEKHEEAENRKDECIVEKGVSESGREEWQTVHMPAFELMREAKWLGLAAVDAFYSWTEHVFVHIAVLRGTCTTGIEVRELSNADWSEKFKKAFDITEPKMKSLYDDLINVRRRLRNYISHGAFGKDGEAFQFHSSVGAVPLRMPYDRRRESFRFGSGVNLDPTEALDMIERFESQLWSGWRAGAKLYLQDYELPTILSMAADGTYDQARSSEKRMTDFTKHLAGQFDLAADMDW